tara:strand:+ start:2271 stop:3029 length:759 start_codon:yes stop_codon:yes gene_type:complete
LYKKKFNNLKQLSNLFQKLGIKKKDNVILHFNFAGLMQFSNNQNKISKDFLSFLKKYLGPKSTILIPTYNYDFAKGKTYNRKLSPSHVGLFGNILLKKYFRNRTYEPIFNHIVFGNAKKEIFECNTKEAFGPKSIFELMKKKNFKIICFCCSPITVTFLHYIENVNKVRYRFEKSFTGKIIFNKKKIVINYKYYVGKKHINYIIKNKKILKIFKKKPAKIWKFGKFECYSIGSRNLYNIVSKEIKNDERFLI